MSEAEKNRVPSSSLSDDAFMLAELLLDVAEKEGVAVARAEFDVAIARAKLRKLREGQSIISGCPVNKWWGEYNKQEKMGKKS